MSDRERQLEERVVQLEQEVRGLARLLVNHGHGSYYQWNGDISFACTVAEVGMEHLYDDSGYRVDYKDESAEAQPTAT